MHYKKAQEALEFQKLYNLILLIVFQLIQQFRDDGRLVRRALRRRFQYRGPAVDHGAKLSEKEMGVRRLLKPLAVVVPAVGRVSILSEMNG